MDFSFDFLASRIFIYFPKLRIIKHFIPLSLTRTSLIGWILINNGICFVADCFDCSTFLNSSGFLRREPEQKKKTVALGRRVPRRSINNSNSQYLFKIIVFVISFSVNNWLSNMFQNTNAMHQTETQTHRRQTNKQTNKKWFRKPLFQIKLLN